MMNEIEKAFSECKTLLDVINVSKELKNAGYNPIEVNKAVSKYKVLVVQQARSINRIPMSTMPTLKTDLTTNLNFAVTHLNKSFVIIADGVTKI